jgi:hypothetical protein
VTINVMSYHTSSCLIGARVSDLRVCVGVCRSKSPVGIGVGEGVLD